MPEGRLRVAGPDCVRVQQAGDVGSWWNLPVQRGMHEPGRSAAALAIRIGAMMKHKRALTIAIAIVLGLGAAAAGIWHFVWLKPYSITPAELQARYAYKEEFQPGEGHSVHLRLQSFDGALLHGRIVYPGDPTQTARPFPVLIGMHAMGRSHLRWWQPDVSGRPTIEQTHRLTQMALQRGYAVVAIDARGHGERRHLGQPTLAKRAMRDMHWFGRRQAYEQMIIDTVRDHRVLLDWLAAQPHLDATRIKQPVTAWARRARCCWRGWMRVCMPSRPWCRRIWATTWPSWRPGT